MSQKSISSFFSKAATKKTDEKKSAKDVPEENPAKTKTCQDNSSATLSKKRVGVIDSDSDDDSKENSKVLANKAKENSKDSPVKKVSEPEHILDKDGLPPLRKTARNPAFKRKSQDDNEESKKLKEDQTEVENEVIKEEEMEVESPVKKVMKGSKKKAVIESSDEENSPVKKASLTKKKGVIESDDDSPVKKKETPKGRKKKAVIESDDEDEKSPVKAAKEMESPVKKMVSSVKKQLKKDAKESTSPIKKLSPKKSPLKEKKSSPKPEPSDEEMDTEETKPSAEKPKKEKSVNSFFTPKSGGSKSKINTPEVKADPATPVAAAAKPKNAFASFFSPKPGAAKRNEGGSDYEKKVMVSKYHPVDDSFWVRDEPTPFLALAKTLESIEATSGRLRTIEMLSNYFRSVYVQTPSDLLPSVYMTLNRLAPAWEGVELGIGDTILMKAIAASCGRSVAQIKTDSGKLGDLGLVAEQSRGGQRTMFQPAILTVQSVFGKLQEIAKITGGASGSKKVDMIQALLVACRGSEARYLIRTLAGKLRIGMAEQSVLQALAQAVVQTPLCQEYPPEIHTAYKSAENEKFKEELGKESLKLKTAYCECPSYDLLIPALLEGGIDNLAKTCKLTPGIPLKPMLAHPTKGVQEVLTRFENCEFTCEWKYDGERAQVHLHEDGTVNIYSRNQEDNTTKFPDIIKRLPNCLSKEVKSAVLDCEAVAWDREKQQIQPFQILSTRKRKDAVEEEIKVQVCLFGFDLLYLNGEALVTKPFKDRRELLRKHFKAVDDEFQYAKFVDGNTTEEIQEALEESIKDNCEGLMVKTLDVDATYEIARRSHNWLKLKKDYLDGVGDTLDLVVLGGYLGKGKRAGGYGGFLLACYDPENEEYQSICKIGTGFTDEDLVQHSAFFKDHLSEKPKSYYSFDPNLAADHWFEPVQVWEVKCADLSISPVHRAATGIVDPSKGVSLRFPRFIRIRDDKKVEDATNADQIATMYNSQDIIKNQKEGKKAKVEDDFDF
eukprot:GFUD01022785.1.p1 GENE.GFUD01022785.1~~GFUD01022785.1.p1  ORF type:complete len:1006 (-),score=309.99 GFUD01022785.1:132-3149(-)